MVSIKMSQQNAIQTSTKMECDSLWLIFEWLFNNTEYISTKIDVQELISITKCICVLRNCQIERHNPDGAR